jgi:TetR/AcrR family transcriptional repressor of nem operon
MAAAHPSAFNTRDEILRVGRELVQTRSYLGFSFQDVADAVGVRKASLYHHFPTKEALGIEVLKEAAQAFDAWAGRRAGAPPERLDAYFRMYRNGLQAGSAVCPAGALVPGWACINEDLQAAVQGLRRAQVGWLADVLCEMGRDAALAERQAAWIYATCQGALITARMSGRVRDFDEVTTQLRAVLLD